MTSESSNYKDTAYSVLVVEDDRPLLNAFARILRDAGHTVLTAEQADSALGILDTQANIGLILCDIGLPGMDGLALLRKLREGRPDVPVVLMTGGPTIQGAIEAVEFGAFRYLTKPIDEKALLDVVSKGLRLRRLALLQREAVRLRALDQAEEQQGPLQRRFEDALIGLWMAYQPIISLTERRIIAYEALMRTSSASMTSPPEMFDAAERLSRVYDLGRVIRRRVAGDLQHLEPGTLAFVNLHPTDLLDDDLFADDAPLNAVAAHVVLEITERAPLDHIDDLKGRLAKLIKRGFRVALDDLGAGYSGLISFTQIEPHIVKLDMALTRSIEQSVTKQKLVQSMLTLCRDLDILTIAEGVETAAEVQTLRELGCDLFQGFYFAKPAMPFCPARFE